MVFVKVLFKVISTASPEQISGANKAKKISGVGFTTKFKVAKLSQPVTTLVSVAV